MKADHLEEKMCSLFTEMALDIVPVYLFCAISD